MLQRKELINQNPTEFINERVSMSNIGEELLRYGLDSPTDLKKFNSLKSTEDIIMKLPPGIYESSGFQEKRKRGDTMDLFSKRPNFTQK
jgi:hypothetical protein